MDSIPQKQCAKCTHFFPATTEYFHANKRGKYGLQGQCKACLATYYKMYSKMYRQTHSEKVKSYNQAYRQTHKEQIKASDKKYLQAHLIEHRSHSHNRRTREHNAKGTHTAQDVQAQYKNQKGKCYYCKKEVGKVYHVDHVIPLSKGGSNGPENLVIACPHCNYSKQAKIVRLL